MESKAEVKGKSSSQYKAHAVCIPSPFQSHIKAMLKLSKLLHHKGFHITFVNTEFNHRRFLKSRGDLSLNGLPGFRFETIPDGLPASASSSSSSEEDSRQDLLAISENIINNVMLPPFLELLAKLNDPSEAENHLPVISCIISDGFMPFTIIASKEFGVPVVMFFTISACSFMGFKQFRTLREKGLTPVKDESCFTKEYMNTIIDWIPGMKDIRIRDLPSFVQTTDANDVMFNFAMEATEIASKASAILIHTFDSLELQVLDALSSAFPNDILAIGPLQFLLNQIEEEEEEDGKSTNSIGYSLWKEETECLQWLDSKQPKSVIYVNFRSFVTLTKQQLTEVGVGLANSNHPFLWIIRPDLVVGGATILPSEFQAKAKQNGFTSSWCPQEQVLNHPSVGGFFTHCGWNSTMESLSAGVPMICWPFAGDQPTNCRYTCNEWEVGIEIGNGEEVNRDQIEKLVRDLMEGENGKKMRKKAMEWRRLAAEATVPHGSSFTNLEMLANKFLSPKQSLI